MAKKVMALVKLHIQAGKATPAPPVGPALGQHGVNIMNFCKAFNSRTNKQEGLIIPVVLTVYQDRSYTFVTKTPPASILLKRAAGLAKGLPLLEAVAQAKQFVTAAIGSSFPIGRGHGPLNHFYQFWG